MIFDLHNDLLTSSLKNAARRKYLELNREHKIILAIWTTRLLNPLDEIERAIKEYGGYPNVLFAVEDLHFLKESDIEKFVKLPLKYCGFAWRDDNALAGGHKGGSGLTTLGREVIAALYKNNIAADTAHLNERSFYQVVESGVKIINSHSCQKNLYYHTRNLSEEQIKAIIAAKGLTGITAVADFMRKDGSLRDNFVRQIDTYAQSFGIDSLSVGTDFFGTDSQEGLENYGDIESIRDSLEKLGFNAAAIDKIFYKNALEYFNGKEH